MKKIFLTILLTIILTSPGVMQARQLAPGQSPLQPPASNTFPNLENNVQSGTGAEQTNQINAPETTLPDSLPGPEENTSAPSSEISDLPPATQGFPWYLMLIIVLISAGISGLYYWFKRTKE